MNRCKTCKWWKWYKDELDQFHPPPVQFECKGPHTAYRDSEGMIDGEDYVGVWTGPDFGCIHHEETQEQLPQDHPGYATQQLRLAARYAEVDKSLHFLSIHSTNGAYQIGQ